MEENKKEENKKEENKQTDMPKRSLILWILAGFYLLYTGYKLCEGVINGAQGSSIGFMIAGIAFIVIGGVLLFLGIKGMMNIDKAGKEQEAAEEPEEEETQDTQE